MSEKQVDINDVLDELKAIIGEQAQQIALLKAAMKTAKPEDKVE